MELKLKVFIINDGISYCSNCCEEEESSLVFNIENLNLNDNK